MILFRLFLGIALLLMGGRLFWLLIGGLGFVFAFDLAERTIHNQPHNVILIIALLAGALGAMAAVFLQKFAVLAGGFISGGYLLPELLRSLGVNTGEYHLILFIAGGLVGALLMKVMFRWALTIISSIAGSVLILNFFYHGQPPPDLLLIGLAIAGVVIQSGLLRKKSSA